MPNDPDVPPQSPRPRRRLRYVLLILLALLLSPVAACAVWTQIEAARLDHVLDALEARNEPLDLAEFDVRPATSEQREASHLYAQAAKLVGDARMANFNFAPVRTAIEELCAIPPAADSRTGIATLVAFEERFKPTLDLLDRASRLDADGWDDADRPKRNSIEEMRLPTLATVNAARIARLACTGNGDAAASALVATLRLRRVLTSLNARLSVQTAHGLQSLLTLTSPSPALLQQIQQEYEAGADERALEKQMLHSRAYWLYYASPGVFSDPPSGYAARRITPIEGIANMLARPLRDHGTVAELREFAEAIEAARQPWPGRLDAAARLAKKYPSVRSQSRRRGLLESLGRPYGSHSGSASLSIVVARDAEGLARVRASVGAVAVARYRLGHDGALPTALQELIPEYLSAPLLDPYTGKELQYRRGDRNKYKVYSVGSNKQDDGGVWEQASDLQLSRRGNPPDIGIAVGAWTAAGRN
jgi:hypothetical protein